MQRQDTNNRPISNSYWVLQGRLAAGEYPGALDSREAARKLRTLIASGIDHFIDLTHPADGLRPYDRIAGQEARSLGRFVESERHSIVDLSVPDRPEEMTRILDAIDEALDRGRNVYVHCWGGVGRTGTVIGCWLVRQGLTGKEALSQIAEWWKDMEKIRRHPASPETLGQCEYVRQWTEVTWEETITCDR